MKSPEFPEGVDRPPDDPTRREFLRLASIAAASASIAACTRAPREKIVPYTAQPPEVTPGIARHYATALSVEGYGVGVIVESHEGRPTKIEGNPRHPASLGASSAQLQAALLQLYDPSRARAIHRKGVQRGWRAFFDAFGAEATIRAYTGSAKGQGLHVLLEPTASPLVASELERLRVRYPNVGVHFASSIDRRAAWDGARAAFGRVLEVHHDFSRVDVVVALDSDFLSQGPFMLRHARDFSRRRRVRSAKDDMNRLYAVEARLSTTGAFADHRARVKRSDVGRFAAALCAELAKLRPAAQAPSASLERLRLRGAHEATIAAMARDLAEHAGRSIVIVGDAQPAWVHALGHAMNAMLGNVGETTWLTESPVIEAGEASHDVGALLAALDRKEVDTLVVLGGNPAYALPVDLDFALRMQQARERVVLGLYEDETARGATWFLSAAHPLERWGLARACDGTTSIVQPLIEPLYQGRTPAEVLAAFSGTLEPDAHAMVRALLAKNGVAGEFETTWERWLQAGVIDGSALPRVDAPIDDGGVAKALDAAQPIVNPLEITFDPDPRVRDGSLTNLAWLLELPDPVTKLTWENAACVSPATAAKLGVDAQDVIELEVRGRTASAPVFVVPGQADETIALTSGWGRTGAERLARGLGVNANALRHSSGACCDAVVVRKTGLRRELAVTQEHWSLEGRDHLRHGTLAEYAEDPRRFADEPDQPMLYKLPLLGEQQWAMSIDLNACTGCSACVVACQAENNIPVVGKQGVIQSREMHWLRIDRYFVPGTPRTPGEGPIDAPRVLHQPMMCQHCERAPCEYVCPVNATVHSPDGINEQVYNRCIGTRFCSNNCAWKVRRFNWFDYNEQKMVFAPQEERDLLSMAMNPDVTVRARGVMEKCTFCVQRVREAEIKGRIGDRPIREGDVTTACAQACPTEAIVFGSITWGPRAEVNVRRDDERAYAALGELGTQPRVKYLAKLVNENPEITLGGEKGDEP